MDVPRRERARVSGAARERAAQLRREELLGSDLLRRFSGAGPNPRVHAAGLDRLAARSGRVAILAAGYWRLTISPIQIGAKGEVQPFETG